MYPNKITFKPCFYRMASQCTSGKSNRRDKILWRIISPRTRKGWIGKGTAAAASFCSCKSHQGDKVTAGHQASHSCVEAAEPITEGHMQVPLTSSLGNVYTNNFSTCNYLLNLSLLTLSLQTQYVIIC